MKTKLIFAMLVAVSCMMMTANASASVRVYGEAQSSGETIDVRLYADISTEVVSYSVKAFYDTSIVTPISATKNTAVWYMTDGTNPVDYMDPDIGVYGEVLLMGVRFDPNDFPGGVMGDRVLLGTIRFARLNRDAPSFSLAIGQDGNFASFVTPENVKLEVAPGEVVFELVAHPENDQDLDALGDDWELEHFGDLGVAFYSDDSDDDRIDNQGEEKLGSDPLDPNSNLKLRVVRGEGEVLIEWDSYLGRHYTVEASTDLREFFPIEFGIEATPPFNSLSFSTGEIEGPAFFRVKLEEDGPGEL